MLDIWQILVLLFVVFFVSGCIYQLLEAFRMREYYKERQREQQERHAAIMQSLSEYFAALREQERIEKERKENANG